MKKSTEFVFQFLLAVIEPLITIVSKVLDAKEKSSANDDDENDENDKN